jgi:hypothetical protein
MNHILVFFTDAFTAYMPLTLILILNVRILIIAEKQRKRIIAEAVSETCNGQPANNMTHINRFFRALRAVKTFSIVVAVLNAFIYGMRHVKYRKAYGHILFKILRCNKLTN